MLFSEPIDNGQGLLNTGLLGASVFSKAYEMIQPEEVYLKFRLLNNSVNASGKKGRFYWGKNIMRGACLQSKKLWKRRLQFISQVCELHSWLTFYAILF